MPTALYDNNTHGFWWLEDSTNGRWTAITKERLESFLVQLGRNPRPGSSSYGNERASLSEIEEIINNIVKNHQIDIALDVAGYPPGIHDMFGKQILVRTGPKLWTPTQGEWTFFEKFLRAVSRKHPIQYHVLKSWLKLGLARIYTCTYGYHQVLFMVGNNSSGKSLFHWMITCLAGGRVSNAEQWLMGQESFNGDVIIVEHVAMEEPSVHNFRDRQRFCNGIKSQAVVEAKRCRGIYAQAISVCPIQIASISTNMEFKNLSVIPDREKGIEDKFHDVLFPEGTMPLEGYGKLSIPQIKAICNEQAPAFLWHLFNEYQIPDELLTRVNCEKPDCDRFGMDAYHNPEITEMIEERSQDLQFLSVMTRLADRNSGSVKGSVASICEHMRMATADPDAVQFAKNPRQVGYLLRTLHQRFPDQCQKLHKTNQGMIWLFLPKPENAN